MAKEDEDESEDETQFSYSSCDGHRPPLHGLTARGMNRRKWISAAQQHRPT